MSFSTGSMLTCLLVCVILTIYVTFILNSQNTIFIYGIKIVFLGIMVVFVRMIIPINYPFTITVPVKEILPQINSVLYSHCLKVPIWTLAGTIWSIGIVLNIIWRVKKEISAIRQLHQYSGMCTCNERKAKRILCELGYGKVSVVTIPQISSPYIIGILRPVIVIPQYSMSEQYLNQIILHEVEHYRNHDLWIKLILETLTCVYWWNPMIYWLRRELQLAMEISNDIVVIRQMEGEKQLEYAEFLVNMGAICSKKKSTVDFSSSSIPLIRRKSDLEIRVFKIIKVALKRTHVSKLSVCINAIIVFIMICCSFLFVLEAYEIPLDVKESSFSLTEEDIFLVETKSGFELYVNGEYQLTLEEIDPTFAMVKIIKRE